jgi:hypothetical protein
MRLLRINSIVPALALFTVLALSSCKKEAGPGGEAEICLLALQSNSQDVTNATYYLKYNSDNFPGIDLRKYDASASASGHSLARFSELKQGSYYVYCVANVNGHEMRGGRVIHIYLKRQTAYSNVTVNP